MASSQVVTTLIPRDTHFSKCGYTSSIKLNSVNTAISASHSSKTASASSRMVTPSFMPRPANSPTSMPTTSGFTSIAPTISAPFS